MDDMTGQRFKRSVADVPAQLALWDAEANTVDPTTIGARSSERRSWRCPVAPDHRWQAVPVAIANSL